ncbi:DNA glycosylase [Massilia terrae]|uniref:DNA-3-methyladenine glycosylase II n=1 Tax=Massilia terrae TaxID=1811224 RepID=A0ABT2CW58_9BURK|nr:DNA-3-methyladenine glycosylase 2 [Massilia terrae]MCS0658201.1 DNA-3-methyladenine glycosylase 2 [Massilia terrae]
MHRLEIALPEGYRSAGVFAFHSRDAEGVAEVVTPGRIRKAVMLDGVPVLLDVAIDTREARCTIDSATMPAHAREALDSILGLRIDPAPFMAAFGGDDLLGPVIQRQPGLRIVQSATVFEALTWAIIGQQINLPFAIALRRTFIQLGARRHESGMWCYPDAADVARLELDELTTRKFSRAKAETLLRVARLVDDGELVLAHDDDPAHAAGQLLAVKGIGPWTVNYTLLRGYGYPDCSLHGDVAIRAAFQRLLGEADKPSIAHTEALLEDYRPHRTMAAAYLWASLNQPAG